jgi:1-pyrroline-5-carboxylate dehydrogenase
MTIAADAKPPVPENEPILGYAPGSPERDELKARLATMAAEEIEIPLIIGGQEVRTGDTVEAVMPHDHKHVLATWHRAGAREAEMAIQAAGEAWRDWSSWSFEDRAAVFLRAADLLAGPRRQTLNAATMLGQSKTAHQAEIDSACELIDFWRFNVHFARRIYEEQPNSAPGMWNQLDYRPLEGFVFAITPGGVSLWKPASSAVYSAYYILQILMEAGLPPGVVNLLPGRSGEFSDTLLTSPEFAGIHFTGSTGVFQHLWRQASSNLESYRSYPRIVGETGGKDFIVAHQSADVDSLAVAIVRGGFEYQGQKCSAASRIYVPDNLWPKVRTRVLDMVGEIGVGDPADFRNFMGAVIDRSAFADITSYIDHAAASDDMEILAGGEYSDEEGYFIQPTLVLSHDPASRLMCEEIFGPVVTVHVYPAQEWSETLELVDRTSPYALTGAVLATDRRAVREALIALRHAAGNFYVNDKPTGAVVGQQPFGGGRASGTNDKAGSWLNLIRWVSPRTIKETFVPATDYRYPFMDGK